MPFAPFSNKSTFEEGISFNIFKLPGSLFHSFPCVIWEFLLYLGGFGCAKFDNLSPHFYSNIIVYLVEFEIQTLKYCNVYLEKHKPCYLSSYIPT